MTLAKIILKLWALRIWVAMGVLVAGAAAAYSFSSSHSTVYSIASTQMLVDSPNSGLGSAGGDITGFATRANVFARLMTSSEALQYIGKAAGIPGNEINANGPVETDGSAAASHAATQIQSGQALPFPGIYKLSFVQNPSLPTIDIYAQAPSTKQAIALANGAVSGFAKFIEQLDGDSVTHGQRINLTQLGPATGGTVDATASKKIAVLIFVGVLAAWCALVLSVSRLRAQIRAAENGGDDLFDAPSQRVAAPEAAAVSGPASFDAHASQFVPADDPRLDSAGGRSFGQPRGHTNGERSHANGHGNGSAPEVAGRPLRGFGNDLSSLRARPQPSTQVGWDSSEQRAGAPHDGDVRDELGLRP